MAGFVHFLTTRLYGGTLPNCTGAFFSPRIWGLLQFFTTRLHGGNQPDDGSIISSRKPILFYNIIMHLLHSCIHCDLDHSCSKPHKSRDGFWPFFYYKTVRWHTTKLHGGLIPEFGGFCPFFEYQTARGNHLHDGSIFSNRKPILFNNTIMHLLQSCTHCDLDHSCSILHKSRDLHFAQGRRWRYLYQTARRQPPWRCHQKIYSQYYTLAFTAT